MVKPIIGVLPAHDKDTNYCRINQEYLSAILKTGGMPILFPLIEEDVDIAWYVNQCDGILFTGGIDIHPELYGEEKLEVCGKTSSIMDSMQLKVMKYILDKEIPALAICRGMQILNIALGGTLHQDLSIKITHLEHRQLNPNIVNTHLVDVKEKSILNMITGANSMSVNSIHHQGIKDLGSDLEVMANSEDGLVEAISYRNQIIAVQWHPEKLVNNDPAQIKIFTYFIDVLCS